MIVVDSSIWIAQLRNLDTPGVQALRGITRKVGRVLVGDLILLEVLQGARNDSHAARLERDLRRFPVSVMCDGALATIAARNNRLLRSRGITIRKTVDLIIGTFCIEHRHRLLHDDRDFDPMAAHLGLSVLQ